MDYNSSTRHRQHQARHVAASMTHSGVINTNITSTCPNQVKKGHMHHRSAQRRQKGLETQRLDALFFFLSFSLLY
jgi:hypothetical protein